MKKIFFIITAILLTSFSTQVLAQNLKGKKIKAKKTFEALNLSEIQEAKFKEIRFEHQERKIDIESELKKNRLEVKKLMSSKNIIEEELMKFIDKGIKLRSELQKSRVKMWYSIYNILDEEQKEIWQDKFTRFGMGGKRFSDCNFDCSKRGRRTFNKGMNHKQGRRQFFN